MTKTKYLLTIIHDAAFEANNAVEKELVASLKKEGVEILGDKDYIGGDHNQPYYISSGFRIQRELEEVYQKKQLQLGRFTFIPYLEIKQIIVNAVANCQSAVPIIGGKWGGRGWALSTPTRQPIPESLVKIDMRGFEGWKKLIEQQIQIANYKADRTLTIAKDAAERVILGEISQVKLHEVIAQIKGSSK